MCSTIRKGQACIEMINIELCFYVDFQAIIKELIKQEVLTLEINRKSFMISNAWIPNFKTYFIFPE